MCASRCFAGSTSGTPGAWASVVGVRAQFKGLAVCLLTAAAASAIASPPLDKSLVRVLPVDGHFVTGDLVAPGRATWMLFMNEHCSLPIQGADKMWRGWSLVYQMGCWYPTGTTANGFVFVDLQGVTHDIDMTPYFMPRAHVTRDGTATIIEPDYDSQTFMARVNNQRIRAALDRMHRQIDP